SPAWPKQALRRLSFHRFPENGWKSLRQWPGHWRRETREVDRVRRKACYLRRRRRIMRLLRCNTCAIPAPIRRAFTDRRRGFRIEHRQPYGKNCPLAHLAFRFDPAAVRIDDPFDD